MTLKLNGYSTAQFGKCHEVPVWQTSPMGPFDMWPSAGGGFETFYGFIGGENNQWYPTLYEGLNPVEPPATPEEGYHLTEDLVDHAIDWVRAQKALVPEKPFFVYFAPGATHAPHHVPKEWTDKYDGAFAHGWDVQREMTFARQKELGVDPGRCRAHPSARRDPGVGRHARRAEARARTADGDLRRVPRAHRLPRRSVVDAIDELGVLDDTLIIYIIGDNGASAEGTMNGTFNEMVNFNGRPRLETPEMLSRRSTSWAAPEAYNHYSVGWAWAMDTPYQWTKQVASHWGGTRNGTIVHWPTDRGGGRYPPSVHALHRRRSDHPRGGGNPRTHDGQRRPAVARWRGRACSTASTRRTAPERHDLQYFEMFANRGIYHNGWSAVTKHRTPWIMLGGAEPRLRRRRVGALRRQQRLHPGP